MPIFSDDRDLIFIPFEKPVYAIGDFPDFYAILEIAPNANRNVIEEAIFSRGADLLAASFSRTGKSQLIQLLETYQNVFRRVLLDPTVRSDYDHLLTQHHLGNDAVSIDEFLEPFRDKKKRSWWRRSS